MCPNSRNVVKRVRLKQTMICGFGNIICILIQRHPNIFLKGIIFLMAAQLHHKLYGELP